jgi:signal transduction histidine kinase/ActR/RegA family two-component response regulator
MGDTSARRGPLLASLRTRLLVLVLVAAVPVVTIVVLSAREQRRLLVAQSSEDTVALTRLVAERCQRSVDQVRGLLLGMSRMRSVVEGFGPVCSARLAPLLEGDPHFVNMGATDPRGRVFCSAAPAPAAVDLSDRAFFIEAIRTGGLGVGEYVVSRIRKTGALGFGYPVRDARGAVTAVAFVSLDVRALQRDLDQLELPPGADVAVLDRAGVTLAARPHGAAWGGRPFEAALVEAARAARGPVTLPGTDGVDRLYAVREVTAPDGTVAMRVVAGIPIGALLEPVNRVSSRALAGSLVACALALAVAVLMAEFMLVRRLRRVAATSQRIAAGDLSARTGLPPRGDEVGELATRFDEMAEALEKLEREKRGRDEQLRQAQKMEVVGQLAGGVAHDFNNLLTVILSATSAIREALPADHAAQEDAREVVHAAERGAALTRQLLAFSRRQALAPRVVNLGPTVRGMERMLQRLLGEGVALSVDVRTPVAVFADPGQLELALLNLAVNARDAMPAGGRVEIAVDAVGADDPARPAGDDVPEGPLALLAVRDTGVGIDPDLHGRIFEPFFTTKAPGRGTGLGLSTVLGIVGQSGGAIRVGSTPGEGSEFRIYLPRRPGEAAAAPEPQDVAPRGSGTILVVEDDERLRAILVRTLRDAGYDVVEAASRAQALAAASGSPGEPALLLTDVMLPDGNGVDLARELGARWPRMPITFVSGYTGEHLSDAGALPPGARFLPKPFTPEVLLQAVREAIRPASAPAPARAAGER